MANSPLPSFHTRGTGTGKFININLSFYCILLCHGILQLLKMASQRTYNPCNCNDRSLVHIDIGIHLQRSRPYSASRTYILLLLQLLYQFLLDKRNLVAWGFPSGHSLPEWRQWSQVERTNNVPASSTNLVMENSWIN